MVTRLILTRDALNVVRESRLSGRPVTEMAESMSNIGIEGLRGNRRMAYHDIIIGPPVAFLTV